MNIAFTRSPWLETLLLAAALAAGSAALAQNANAPGQAKKQAQPVAAAATTQTVPPAVVTSGSYLNVAQRKAIQDYYDSQRQRTGRCPPGLAKKNNGCMPPGQAKKWAMGQPLPGDVIYRRLPEDVLRKIGITQKGVEIVRILNDILVLEAGTRMVLDAVEILTQP